MASTLAEAHSAARRNGPRAGGGMRYLVADGHLGPFQFSTQDFLIGDPRSLYCGKLVEGLDGHPVFLAWRNVTPEGAFVGELANPFQGAADEEGNLSVGIARGHQKVDVLVTRIISRSCEWVTPHLRIG